ncbi:MAG: ester cyclase [Thermoplasmata archaeon]|nr:MAG: ester cyclase [Thermoplasmata archaeon]
MSNRVIDKQRLGNMLSQGKDAFPDRKWTIERIMTKDNAAMVEWTWTATHTGEYRGFPATGNRIEFPGVDILEFESGKVKYYKYVFNMKLFESGYNPQR